MRCPQASFEAQPRFARLLAPKMGIGPYIAGAGAPLGALLLLRLQLLDDLDHAAGAEAGRAELDELFRVLQRRNAAGGLDLHAGLYVLREQLHVMERRAAGGEAGGGLDVVCAGIGDDFAHLDLLVVRQQARLDDDLQELALAVLLDGLDLFEQIVPALVLDPADVDDHVDLVRAVLDRVERFEALGLRRVVAVREADDGADGQLVPDVVLRLLHIGSGDADGRGMILHAVVADGLDLGPGRRLGEEGVIDFTEDLVQFHGEVPPFCVR